MAITAKRTNPHHKRLQRGGDYSLLGIVSLLLVRSLTQQQFYCQDRVNIIVLGNNVCIASLAFLSVCFIKHFSDIVIV